MIPLHNFTLHQGNYLLFFTNPIKAFISSVKDISFFLELCFLLLITHNSGSPMTIIEFQFLGSKEIIRIENKGGSCILTHFTFINSKF